MSEPTATAAPRDPSIIRHYHAHVYYDPASTRETASRLRERVGVAFPAAQLGRWHDELVEPHLRSMYQIAFPCELLGTFLPWLMLNRDGLTVLLHPGTSNPYADHTAHAVWLGEVLPLRTEVLDGEPRNPRRVGNGGAGVQSRHCPGSAVAHAVRLCRLRRRTAWATAEARLCLNGDALAALATLRPRRAKWDFPARSLSAPLNP